MLTRYPRGKVKYSKLAEFFGSELNEKRNLVGCECNAIYNSKSFYEITSTACDEERYGMYGAVTFVNVSKKKDLKSILDKELKLWGNFPERIILSRPNLKKDSIGIFFAGRVESPSWK